VVRFTKLLLAALACYPACAQPATPVILISIDTLRADHLSSYRAGRHPTPHIDSLAKNGTLFSKISSPYPLTLPSHTALFTSTYPFANGVRDNGIPLHAGAVTLATVLKHAGYRTGAFVSSFVLDRRFGLNRGFDVYDGPIDLHNKVTPRPVERKRAGSETAAAAMRWLDHNSSGAFFLFLHLYDLHLPYDLGSYSSEVSYEDRVVGDFLAYLQRRGLLDKALIAFTSDHGEGLGDHGESTHGYFLYQSTLHVPLIVHWPSGFKRFQHDHLDEPASLLDVAPTILDALGVPAPAEMHGRSLIGGGAAQAVYSESIYARDHFGCAAIRSMRAGRYKYIEGPKPELYDVSTDPTEMKNLYLQQRSIASGLEAQIEAVRASAPATKTATSPKPDAVASLRSLGYLSGSSKSTRAESHIDPKDRIADFERYISALSLGSEGKTAESSRVLQTLADKLPDVSDIRINLGLNEQRLGDYGSAAREFKRAIEQNPSDAQPHFELGFCYFHLGESGNAVQESGNAVQQFKAALALEPWYTRADEALAEIYIQAKDLSQARAHLNHLLSIDPNSYTGHYNLGIMAAMQGNWNDAEQHVAAALRADPSSAEAHDTLGKIYFQRGELVRARQEFEETIRLQPKLASGHYDLAMVFQKQGKTSEAAQELRAAQATDAREQ
jgi:tetratricopeptide (TPR) repeat protein